jgi:NADPH2:quinone reductase
MAHAVHIHDYGGPETLSWGGVEVGDPGPGEARIRQTAIGLNYIDIYHRTGLYKVPSLPAIIGMEGAGVIEAVGAGVCDLKIGDHVAYAGVLGAYSVERLITAEKLVKVPNTIDDVTAAAMMLQGMTARYLLRETYRCSAETTLLFHAAAGGVGLIACQWANSIGANMIGTVGSDEKAQLAKENGCRHVINYRNEDFVARVRELTNGKGCDVVYDSIGKDTFPASLDCLKPKGMWVIGILSLKGSLFATRPSLMTYTECRDDLLANAGELFEMVTKGAIKIPVSRTYPLKEAGQAHRALEARKTTGSIVLLP